MFKTILSVLLTLLISMGLWTAEANTFAKGAARLINLQKKLEKIIALEPGFGGAYSTIRKSTYNQQIVSTSQPVLLKEPEALAVALAANPKNVVRWFGEGADHQLQKKVPVIGLLWAGNSHPPSLRKLLVQQPWLLDDIPLALHQLQPDKYSALIRITKSPNNGPLTSPEYTQHIKNIQNRQWIWAYKMNKLDPNSQLTAATRHPPTEQRIYDDFIRLFNDVKLRAALSIIRNSVGSPRELYRNRLVTKILPVSFGLGTVYAVSEYCHISEFAWRNAERCFDKLNAQPVTEGRKTIIYAPEEYLIFECSPQANLTHGKGQSPVCSQYLQEGIWSLERR